MIEKLEGAKRISGDYLIQEPLTIIQVQDKINEIIDVINERLLNEEVSKQ